MDWRFIWLAFQRPVLKKSKISISLVSNSGLSIIILFILHVSFVIVLFRFRLRMYDVKQFSTVFYLYRQKRFTFSKKIRETHIITPNICFSFLWNLSSFPNKIQFVNKLFGSEQEPVQTPTHPMGIPYNVFGYTWIRTSGKCVLALRFNGSALWALLMKRVSFKKFK